MRWMDSALAVVMSPTQEVCGKSLLRCGLSHHRWCHGVRIVCAELELVGRRAVADEHLDLFSLLETQVVSEQVSPWQRLEQGK